MIPLQPVLSVRELPPACAKLRSHLPSLRDFICSTPGPRESEALSYLRQGVACGLYYDRGLLYDVLQPGRLIEPGQTNGTSESSTLIEPHVLLTDGRWIWPGALPYYVATYH